MLQTTQIFIISIIKFIKGVYTLVFKPKFFKIRNSPLRRNMTPIYLINGEQNPETRANLIGIRSASIRYFIIIGAPFITLGLYDAINPNFCTKAKSLLISVSESLLLLFS